jgi:hypothetical protein
MNIKRASTAILISGAVLLWGSPALAASTPPPGGDDTFNACLDYSTVAGNGGVYALAATGSTTTVLNFKYSLVEPSCRNATYTFVVVSGGTLAGPVLWQDVREGDATNQSFYENASFVNGPSSVCVYATTSVNGKLYDRAPDSGCLSLSTTGGSGTNGFF